MRTLTTRRLAGLQAWALAASLMAVAPSHALAQADAEPSAGAPSPPPPPAVDPNEPPKRRLDRLEREVNEVRQIVLQARATGHPVEIKDAGPDPELAVLQTKLDDIQASLATQTGQIETLTHDLNLARQDAADAKAADASLADRLDKLEKQVAAQAAPPPPPPPPEGAAGDAPQADAGPGGAGGDPKTAYAQAKQMMLDGDYAAAAQAFQAYVDHYGDQPNASTARYWLGEVKFAQEDYAGAAQSFVAAIHGWPQTSWAPGAVIKLSQSLIHLNKPDEACAALDEFRRRYRRAPDNLRADADQVRVQAQCSR